MIKKDALVLFQGDSITDCGRSRNDDKQLGNGYASMVAARFNALYPDQNIRFINKGISGDRTKDLVKRWKADCLDLKPDVVSILIGINDTWRRFDSNSPTTAETYKDNYRRILAQIRESLDAKIIILEPFLLPVSQDMQTIWRDDLDPKIHAARELAREFGDVYIPLDGIFAAAAVKQPPQFWAEDGVHPTPAGHALITHHWLKAIERLWF